jgi:hypothetical protein
MRFESAVQSPLRVSNGPASDEQTRDQRAMGGPVRMTMALDELLTI